jgi:predicted acetyltransferase
MMNPRFKYQPTTHCIHWCAICDQQQVDSLHPMTGQFYALFGHEYNPKKEEYSGDYKAVMLAICSVCEPTKESEELRRIQG